MSLPAPCAKVGYFTSDSSQARALFDETGTDVSAFLCAVAFNVANLLVLSVLIARIGPRGLRAAAA